MAAQKKKSLRHNKTHKLVRYAFFLFILILSCLFPLKTRRIGCGVSFKSLLEENRGREGEREKELRLRSRDNVSHGSLTEQSSESSVLEAEKEQERRKEWHPVAS